MLNFFAIVIIIFIGLLLLIFKKRKFENSIALINFYSRKLKRTNQNNNKFLSNKKIFLMSMERKITHYFINILKETKCLVFFKAIKKIN